MKMAYLKIISEKNSATGDINTKRFYAEEEIKIDNLDEFAKQKLMLDTAHDLDIAGAAMLKKMVIDKEDE